MPTNRFRRLPPGSAAALSLPAPLYQPTLPVPAAEPPRARRIPWADRRHGELRQDEFHWLRDRDDPAVRAYLDAENRYADRVMRHTEPLQQRLFQEMAGRIEETDESVPEPLDQWLYYTRMEAGRQYPLHCRRLASADATTEEVLLDLNHLADGHPHLRLGWSEPSPDHRHLAFTVDFTGDEAHTLFIRDLVTGRLLPERIPDAGPSLAWADDGTLFYIVVDEARRPWELRRHRLGTDPADDQPVYAEQDEAFVLEVGRSRSRDWIFLESASGTTTEIRGLRPDHPSDAPRILLPRTPGVEYAIAHRGGRFYILTNKDAENFRVVEASEEEPGRWREVVGHRPAVKLDAIDAFRDHLVIWERDDGLPGVLVIDLTTGDAHRIALPESAWTVHRAANPEFDTATLRLAYTSLVTPMVVADYDMAARELRVRKRAAVRGYDPSRYRAERLTATAPDGVAVPVSLVYRWPFPLDGSRPALLLGYGAYGACLDPAFSPHFLSLLDRGFVVAIAHVRGGEDLGRRWYEGGKLLNKPNTFADFIAAAEHLIAEGYTAAARLAINGASAGGLLMGAVTNLRPDLFHAVVAEVPFLDVLNTMLDPSLPLTVTEYEEWGDPADRAAYACMRSYSPYDNIEARPYPHMLVTAGLNDPRVAYWEPAKWTARLRARKTDRNRLLLRTNMGAGHAGASGRYDALREVAFKYAFVLDVLGLD